MNFRSLVLVLTGLATASALDAASSSSGSLDPAAAVPLCSQDELVVVGSLLKNNQRKIQCQKDLGVEELTTIRANETKTLRAMCDDGSCTKALEQLYTTLPDCRYKDWAIKYNTERLLMQCGIDPSKVTSSSTSGENTTTGSVGSNTTVPSPTVSWGSSSGETTFAPIGTTPKPTPAVVPTPSPTSAGSSLQFISVAAAVVVATASAAF